MLEVSQALEHVCNVYEQTEIHELGFDVFEACEKLGIQVIPYSYIEKNDEDYYKQIYKKHKDGLSTIKKDIPMILYNDKITTKPRIRYTICHELAHIFLSHNLLDPNLISDEQEKDANLLADILIAPFVLVCKYEIESEEQMRETFQLSNTNAKRLWKKYNNKIVNDTYYATPKEGRLLEIFEKNVEKYK